MIPLSQLARARSGDKGSGANIGVIARTPEAWHVLLQHLTAERVEAFFQPFGARGVQRFELPNLQALNFVIPGVLSTGGGRCLRNDAQGKALGQALLEMKIPASEAILPAGGQGG